MKNSKKSITQKIVSFFKSWHLSPQGSRQKPSGYSLPEVQSLLKKSSESISEIIDELNSKLPNGIIAEISPFTPPYNTLHSKTKHVTLGLITKTLTVPQEFLEEVKLETQRLKSDLQDTLDSQTPPPHQIPHIDGVFFQKKDRLPN